MSHNLYLYWNARDYANVAYHFLALVGAIAGAVISFYRYFDSYGQMDIPASLKQRRELFLNSRQI